MKNYLVNNNIKFIHGRAYNSHPQGHIGLFYRTLKINLIWKKLEEGDNLNLNASLNKCLYEYNNIIHSSIGYKPI